VKNPVRAFLKNALRAELNDKELTVVYSAERKDHVKRLSQDKFGAILRSGVKEFFGEDYEVDIRMDNSDPSTADQEDDSSSSSSESDPSRDEKFLRESRELLQNES
jgi:hypothetical protein